MQDPQRDAIDGADLPADSAADQDNPLAQRHIRSFVLRQGRVSSAQLRYLDDMMPKIGIEHRPQLLDFAATFGREAPTVFEIGFGMGETSAKIAAVRPDTNFIEVEVHTPGVGSLCKLVAEGKLGNIRIIQHDAVEVLRDMIPENSLAGAHIYFPDPWPKKRHHKRRLVQPPLIALLASRLAPGGYLHCATDWEEYAVQMLEVLSAEPLLENTVDNRHGGFAPRPDYRPLTKFEQRGIRLGHGVWDVIFRKK
ncbi:MAG: tRNA (guanosine(46)-N7)-methyltransferase TrmB [Pseudomonadota bacterium]